MASIHAVSYDLSDIDVCELLGLPGGTRYVWGFRSKANDSIRDKRIVQTGVDDVFILRGRDVISTVFFAITPSAGATILVCEN